MIQCIACCQHQVHHFAHCCTTCTNQQRQTTLVCTPLHVSAPWQSFAQAAASQATCLLCWRQCGNVFTAIAQPRGPQQPSSNDALFAQPTPPSSDVQHCNQHIKLRRDFWQAILLLLPPLLLSRRPCSRTRCPCWRTCCSCSHFQTSQLLPTAKHRLVSAAIAAARHSSGFVTEHALLTSIPHPFRAQVL